MQALATKIGALGVEVDRVQSNQSWFERNAEELGLELDDAMKLQLKTDARLYSSDDKDSAANVRKKKRLQLERMRGRLKALLDDGEQKKAALQQHRALLEEAGATATVGSSSVVVQ